MKHLKCALFIILLIGSLFFSIPLLATTRGISVISKEGESVYLYKDYHALVVGVGDYTKGWPDLPGAVKDAREVASSLKELGFKVKLILDPTSSQLRSALNEMAFGAGMDKNRALLLYFAGHGETLELADGTKLGYIIPTDCPLKKHTTKGFDERAISMKEIETLVLKIKSKHLLTIFDSCFSGSFFSLFRAAPADITEKSARPVRQFITAGEAGEQVPDYSVFKMVFLDGIRGAADYDSDSYVTGSELGRYLQDKVVKYTRGKQHPQYGKINNPKLDKGDFVFALKGALNKEQLGRVEEVWLPKASEQSQDELDLLISRIKEKEEEEEAAESKSTVEKLFQDLEKYERITSSDLNPETKSAAWEICRKKYPSWTAGVNPGDLDSVFRRAYAENRNGFLLALSMAGSEIKKLALMAVPVVVRNITLRKEPKKLYETDIKNMLAKYDFFNSSLNPKGSFENLVVDIGDGTIVDFETGLMWQKGGSSSAKTWNRGRIHVKQLNRTLFAGYSDWRLPTIDELASLVEREKANGIHIDPIFYNTQKSCWSADKGPLFGGSTSNPPQVWHVDFREGSLGLTVLPSYHATVPTRRYVRAVRSIE